MPERVIAHFHEAVTDLLKRFSVASWLLIFALSLLVTFIITISFQRVPAYVELGAVAGHDIKADRDYEIIDEESTQTFRDDARKLLLPIYAYDEGLVATIAERVKKMFEEVRAKQQEFLVAKAADAGVEVSPSPEEKKNLREFFEKGVGVPLADEEWKLLLQENFNSGFARDISALVQKQMSVPIVADRKSLDEEKKGIIVAKTRVKEGQRVIAEETKVENIVSILSVNEVKTKLAEMHPEEIPHRTKKEWETIVSLASQLIQANCAFDRQETAAREAQAVASVKNVIIKVQAGEMIVRNGSRFEPQHLKVLRGIQKERGSANYTYQFLGTFLIVFLMLVLPFYLSEKFIRRFHPSRKDYILMAAVGIFSLLILRFSLAVSPAIQQAFFFPIPDRVLIYAIPLAGSVMLVRMLLSAEAALVFAIPMAIFTGLFGETGMRFTVFALVSALAAVSAASHIDRRVTILRAGALVGLINMVAMGGLKLISMTSVTEVQSMGSMMWFLVMAFMGGISSGLLVMIALPVVESLSGYVTDIKLLELANLNHPLLRELIVRAPGTYHHSHLVGILAEAAAEKIGANSLLVRVAAYYHDVGKMKKPSYFIENSKGLPNRHDSLKPNMSAMIVASHVKEGVEMATAAGIPKVIVDMIPQHHGTRLIGYFYEKAKEQVDPELERVAEEDYRYPGPKPQTREAAIMMLADVVEASVRALKEKTSVRIRQTVQRSITDVFSESQLDECELTLKDLNDIGNAFVHILLGIYHQRIEYPKEISSETGEVHHLQPPSQETLAEPQSGPRLASTAPPGSFRKE